MNICQNKDKAIAIEDAFMAFVLARKLDQKQPEETIVKFFIEREAVDSTTGGLFQLIVSGHAGPIDEFSILYSYESDDVIFEVCFFKQENEMAEFVGDWIGRMKKSRIYRMRFDTADDFISFFNEFHAKSMKEGTSYEPWRIAHAN